MNELVITPDFDKKSAKIRGRCAAGEHVLVRLVGGAALPTGALRLCVMLRERLFAVFPVASGDDDAVEWSVDGEDLTCVLNLNTEPLVKFARCGALTLEFILDDPSNHVLYFSAMHEVLPWHSLRTRGDDAKPRDTQPFDGVVISTKTLTQLREAVKRLAEKGGAQVIGSIVLALLAVRGVFAATVTTAPLNDLEFDTNPQVVTSVTFEGLSESSNVYTKAETEAKIVELVPQTETDPVWSAEKSGYATKADLTNKVDKSGVHIGSMFIGFSDEGVYVRDMVTGKGVLLSDDKMARKTATGEVFYYAYPNGSGTFAFASDIPSTNGFLTVETDPVWNAEKNGYTTKDDLESGMLTVNRAEYAESARDAYSAEYATLAEGLRDGPTEIYAGTIFSRLDAASETNAMQSAAISTLSTNVYTKAEAATKDELDAKLDKSGGTITGDVEIARSGSSSSVARLTLADRSALNLGDPEYGVELSVLDDTGSRLVLWGNGIGEYQPNKITFQPSYGGTKYNLFFPSASGTFALLSDIPTTMAWSAITGKPTTISGYGITDALKSDFTSLTNNAAFSSAVAAVSPPADTSELEARGFVRIVADDEIYFVTITTTQTEE